MQETEEPALLPVHVRAARALLGWNQDQLAEAAGVGNSTVRGFEVGRSAPRRAHLVAIRTALESAGVGFIFEDGRIGAELRMPRTASTSAMAVAPSGGGCSSPTNVPEDEPLFPEPETVARASLAVSLDDAEALVERMRREAKAREIPHVRRRDLLRCLRLVEEAADDCLDAMARIRAGLDRSRGALGGTSHREGTDRDSGETVPLSGLGWRLVEHACRTCGSRVLRRGGKFRCASCAMESTGTPENICGCGLLDHLEGRHVTFRCVRNPDISVPSPTEIVIEALVSQDKT